MLQQRTLVTCPICGLTTTRDELEEKPDGTGAWCCDCQTFIWYQPDSNMQRSTILLEQKANTTPQAHPVTSAIPGLRKRLSPLRYPGGKSKVIDELTMKLQQSKLDTFVEVFAGGASFGLALLDAGRINHLVLNDADKNLMNFWAVVLSSHDFLIEKLQTITPTHADYEAAKAMLSSHANASPLELAWAYLLVNRLSYSGIQKAGCLGGKAGSNKALLARYNPKALQKQITHIASLKNQITLLNQDCHEVIENYYWNDKATLFIDPPYYKQGNALYNLAFNDDDHRALANLLQSLLLEFPNCADILITYDNAPFIEELYWFMEPTKMYRTYSI